MRNTRSAPRAYSQRRKPEVSTQRGFSFLDWTVQNKINFWSWLTFFFYWGFIGWAESLNLKAHRHNYRFHFFHQLFKSQGLIKCYYFQVHMRMPTEQSKDSRQQEGGQCAFFLWIMWADTKQSSLSVCVKCRESDTHMNSCWNRHTIKMRSMRFRWGADGPVACGHDTNIIYHNRETLAILQISGRPDVMPRIKCCQVVGGANKTRVLPKWFPLEIEQFQFWCLCCLRSGCSRFRHPTDPPWSDTARLMPQCGI